MKESEDKAAEAPNKTTSLAGNYKVLLGIIAAALLISLINTVLLLINPTARKVEQFNEELKTDLAESVATLHKKIDGLRSAELEWQNVLKKASEKPDAVYKIVNSGGLLTLTEIEAASTETQGETSKK